jgi:16S rRNA (uracil1498-N3)-methyltransferase
MNLFYSDPSHISDTKLVLEQDEARHAIRALRHKTGDSISVTDGKGSLYEAIIVDINQQEVTAEIRNIKTFYPADPQLTLAIGLIKKRDRLEFAVEKCTELGINNIVIYQGDHSEKTGIRTERIDSIILRAMKQSLRFFLPKAALKNSLSDVILAQKFTRIIAADETKDSSENQNLNQNGHHLLVVGPEGGFSENERKLLDTHNVDKITLGRYRLRTETAAIVLTAKFRGLE